MRNTMLLGVLKMSSGLWFDDEIDICQRHSIYVEAAERIEELERFIKNGVEHGFISIPEEPDPARKIIDEILNR